MQVVIIIYNITICSAWNGRKIADGSHDRRHLVDMFHYLARMVKDFVKR